MTDHVPGEAAAGAIPAGADDAVAAYENAKLHYLRAVTRDAEAKLRDAFARQRETYVGEINELRALARQRQETANMTAAAYAMHLPHRVRRSGLRRPSIWERLGTTADVEALYREAARAASELDDVNELIRTRHERLEAMERDTRRSISLREEAVRRKLQTPEGLAALHDDPLVRTAFAKMQLVLNERARNERRAPPDDRVPADDRDRDMRQTGRQFAAVPLHAVMIVRIVRYGPLAYYVLRDLAKREYLLSCDPVLEPLREFVFDLTHTEAGYEAALRHGSDEEPMRVIDHLKLTYSASEATAAYALHRSGLQSDRPATVTPPRDAAEAEMIAMLGLLAQAVAQHGRTGDGEPGASA